MKYLSSAEYSVTAVNYSKGKNMLESQSLQSRSEYERACWNDRKEMKKKKMKKHLLPRLCFHPPNANSHLLLSRAAIFNLYFYTLLHCQHFWINIQGCPHYCQPTHPKYREQPLGFSTTQQPCKHKPPTPSRMVEFEDLLFQLSAFSMRIRQKPSAAWFAIQEFLGV